MARISAALLALVLLAPGCHSLSSEAITELQDTVIVCDRVLADWDKLQDAQKKTAVSKVGRTCATALLDAGVAPVGS